MTTHMDVSVFEYDETLAHDRQAFVVVKGFGQLDIVAKIIQRQGSKSFGLTAVNNVAERRYSKGRIALASLDTDAFDELTLQQALTCTEPFEVMVQDGQMAFTAGYQFGLADLGSGKTKKYSDEWMSYLHSIELSDDGQRVLTAATGLDTILEIDLASGEVVWEWNAWDNGFNRVKLDGSYVSRDPAQARQLEQEHPDAEILLIEDPLALPREGLATNLTPMNLNGVHYGKNGRIIATGFHRPELFVIKRDGSYETYNLGLSHPHSFRPLADGYMVASTGHGQLLLLDDRFKVQTRVDISTLPANQQKKAGFGEWLQTVSVLDQERGLFSLVDALRDGVHLVDVNNQTRRFISNPPEWTIQAVMNAPISKEGFQRLIGSKQLKSHLKGTPKGEIR